jgi:GT2 family glycosyltransferase
LKFGYELIVVDNASCQEVRLYLATFAACHNIFLLQNDTNLGVAYGRNTAYAFVKGEFILAIDDDTRVPEEVLRDLPDLMRKKYPKVGILALRVLHAGTKEDQNDYGGEERLVANHHGAACAIRREVLARVGGIDDYCAFGSEEIDLCIRAHAAGFEIRYTPELVAFHNNNARQGAEFFDRVRMRVFNNARTMHKYFPMTIATRFSMRYLGRMSLRWLVARDASVLGSLFLAWLRGCYLGLRYRTPIPKETVRHYSDLNLVPEFGNQPFFRQLIKRNIFRPRRTKG